MWSLITYAHWNKSIKLSLYTCLFFCLHVNRSVKLLAAVWETIRYTSPSVGCTKNMELVCGDVCVQHTKIDKQRRTTNTLKDPTLDEHSIMQISSLSLLYTDIWCSKSCLPLYESVSKPLQHKKNIIEDPVAATHFSLMQQNFSCIVTS